MWKAIKKELYFFRMLGRFFLVLSLKVGRGKRALSLSLSLSEQHCFLYRSLFRVTFIVLEKQKNLHRQLEHSADY